MCCRLLKCCCCIELRVGVIIIACLWLLGDLLLLVWTAYRADEMMKLTGGILPTVDEIERQIFITGSFLVSVFEPALHCLEILLDIMLLAGAITAQRNLLHGWMVAYVVVYCAFLPMGIFFVVGDFVFVNVYQGLIYLAILLLNVGLMVYFWVVVRSYYLQLCQRYGEGGPRTTAGNVYCTVPTGDVVPAQGTYYNAGGMPMAPMAPTAPPRYVSNA